jgi:hypothetical protein
MIMSSPWTVLSEQHASDDQTARCCGRSMPLSSAVRRAVALGRRPPRWRAYRRLIRLAQEEGYLVRSLESWLCAGSSQPDQTLLLRHDVDRSPLTAAKMAKVEEKLGLRSTFYFRWSTFDRGVITSLSDRGFHVGLHYETLTRYAIVHDLRSRESVTPDVISRCRKALMEELSLFARLTGVTVRSVAAHGDPRARLIGHTNDVLLRGENYDDYGLAASADDTRAKSSVDCWVSDGSGVSTFWNAGVTLPDAVRARHNTVLFNSHPHHWQGGAKVLIMRGTEIASTRLNEGRSIRVAEARAWERWAGRH